MSNIQCKKFDDEFYVERYIAGELSPEEKNEFESHLQTCAEHSKAIALEKALKHGVKEFARSELKSAIKKRFKKKEDNRLLILRFAAIFFLVVITPLILYYHYQFELENEYVVTQKEHLQPSEKVMEEAEIASTEDHEVEKKAARSLVVKKGKSLQRPEKLLQISPEQEDKSEDEVSIFSEEPSKISTVGQSGLSAAGSRGTTGKLQKMSEISTDYSLKTKAEADMSNIPYGKYGGQRAYYKSNRKTIPDALHKNITDKLTAVQTQLMECVVSFGGEENYSLNTWQYIFEISSTGELNNLRFKFTDDVNSELKSCFLTILQSVDFPKTKKDIVIVQSFVPVK